MTKYYFLIVLALVSLALISVPKTAVAQPAPTPIQEPAPKVFEDAVLGEKWRVIINKKAVLAYKNNNPGNLRYAGQRGASKGYGGFAYFENPYDGFNALKNQIKLDARRGLTVEQFVHKFAPPIENDTSLYLDQVTDKFEIEEEYLLSDMPVNSLAIFVAMKESGTIVQILP